MLVEKKTLQLSQPYTTGNGCVLKQPQVVYEEYGLAEGPVIYIAHGGLSDAHAAGRYSDSDPLPGWWDALIGPGKPFDTDRYRVICANSLGNMGGSTSPASINPDTGCRYGPLFPQITLIDMVRFHKAFLEELGVERLEVMAGPSMGSLQSLQMAALYPDFVGAVVAVATAGRMPPSGLAMHHLMMNFIKMDPEFQGGWYDTAKPLLALKYIHQTMRIYYTHEKIIKRLAWDPVPEGPDAQDVRARAVNAYLASTPDLDVRGRDPNCYLALLSAINSYDLGRDAASFAEGVRRIRCPVLMMNIDTDCEFDVVWAEEVAAILNEANPGQARVELLRSPWGHLGCVREGEQMSAHIRGFLSRV